VHPRLEAALVFDPSSHVGGDFCDLFELPDGRIAAAVGDVVGHGVAAALLMASVRGAMRAFAEQSNDLAEIMRRLNRHACRETGPGEFVTLLLVAVDADARSLRICNAGHETPLRLRAGEIATSETASLVLGLDPNEKYEEAALDLQPGDFVLLYTDGVIEAMNFEDQLFTRERLHGSLGLHGIMPPEPALRNIHWDIRRFVGLAEQNDDLTMIGLRVKM
jgi:sigma-B regulation protein RsbU (phosphoserine phosphatase)